MKLTKVNIHLTPGGTICLYKNTFEVKIITRDGVADHNGGPFKCMCDIGSWYRQKRERKKDGTT